MTYSKYSSAIQRPQLVVFYVLDTSGSMRGNPITQLNRAMVSTIETLRDEAEYNRDAEIKVAVLDFNSTCRWMQPQGPEDLENFVWDDLEAGTTTEVHFALDELNSKLTDRRGGFIDSSHGALMPVIIFMTDGHATCSEAELEAAITRIGQNRWFTRATRVGFAIGKSPDIGMLARLTDSSEAVLRTEDLNLFAAMIKWVSVTSTMIASDTRARRSGNKGAQAVGDMNERMGRDRGDVGHNTTYESKGDTGRYYGPYAADDDFDSENPF